MLYASMASPPIKIIGYSILVIPRFKKQKTDQKLIRSVSLLAPRYPSDQIQIAIQRHQVSKY